MGFWLGTPVPISSPCVPWEERPGPDLPICIGGSGLFPWTLWQALTVRPRLGTVGPV